MGEPRGIRAAVAVASLLVLTGCSAASPTPSPSASGLAQLDGMTHYDGDWDAWYAAGTPDNGEFALFAQWRSPEKDATAVEFLKTDEQAVGYSYECTDEASDDCEEALGGFAAMCQQLYDRAPAMLRQLDSADGQTKDPTLGMLGIYCPDVLAHYESL